MKICSVKTRQQDCISKPRNIRVKNVNSVIIGTLNINSLASKFDEFKLVVNEIFDNLVITETKLDKTFPTSQFYIEGFPMPYMDRNRNGGGIIICIREHIPTKILTKRNLRQDIEGIFLEINFRKSNWLLCGIYHTPQNDQCFFDNIDKALDIYCSYEKIVLADFNAQEGERLLNTLLYKVIISCSTCCPLDRVRATLVGASFDYVALTRTMWP